MGQRIRWIDIAKGIAIICVFLGHTISTPSLISRFIYYFHMPLFFLLSGFCFSNRRNLKDFTLNKLKTVVLPIFSLGLTGAVIVAVFSLVIKHEAPDWKWVFLNPIVQYKEHSLLWYLASLFAALMIFYGITKLLKDRTVPIIISAFILGTISYMGIKYFNFDLPWNVPTALVALPFLAVGYSLKKTGFYDKLNQKWIPAASFLGCAAAGYFNSEFFGGVEMHSNSYGNISLFYVSALCGCVMVVSISMLAKENTMLEYFGRNSLIFYAIEPIQYFVNFSVKALNGIIPLAQSVVSDFIITVAAVAVICILSTVAAQIINRYFPFLTGKPRRKKS